MDSAALERTIDEAWEGRDQVDINTRGPLRDAIEEALTGLDEGRFRVAEKAGDAWQVNQWLKKAVLLSFRIYDMQAIAGGPGSEADPWGAAPWFDKVPSKFAGWGENRFRAAGFRAVPNCTVRRSAYIAPGVVLMPCFVNLGAHVGEGTMVDTWATVGSCAQVGKNCHISGGAGLGGVLEPLQAGPVIVEDNCFIGARSEVVEGVVVARRLGDFDGRLHRRLDQDRRPRDRRGPLRPGAGLLGGGARQPARQAPARRARPAPASTARSSSSGSTSAPAPRPRSTSCCAPEAKEHAGDRRHRGDAGADPLPSVTPAEGGALDLLQSWLEPLGFECHRLVFSEPGQEDVDNLYARLGKAGANFCYAGHTDVVPVGDPADWKVDPFGAEIHDGVLYGRGAVDMKGSIAAYLAALSEVLSERGTDFGGSVSLLITGDEEGIAVNGTRKVLDWLAERGETLDHCLVGEPTSDRRLGDMVKIGRRGAMNGRLTVHGTQGHSAYAHLADNPVHRLVRMLNAVTSEPLDAGSEFFPADQPADRLGRRRQPRDQRDPGPRPARSSTAASTTSIPAPASSPGCARASTRRRRATTWTSGCPASPS